MASQFNNSEQQPRAAEYVDRAEAWALPGFLVLLALLCIVHAVYLSLSGMTPSADEAHYMSGALSIADGLRTGTWSGAWAGYRDALGFKAPLICVPAGFLMLITKSSTLPFSATLVLIFAALGVAAYSLFRNCFDKFQAACAATVLLCMPLVTGLTHRYYVELLVLLLSVIMLDLLVRAGWRTYSAAVLIGIVFGLGILAKTTFALLLAASLGLSLWIEVLLNRVSLSVGIILKLFLKLVIAGLTALLVAGPWYVKNWYAVIAHVREASSATAYYYANWVIADMSAGPSIVIGLLSLIGLAVLLRQRPTTCSRAFHAWLMILSAGISTVLGVSVSVAKTPRFEATALPMFAALAITAFCPLRTLAGQRWFRKAPGMLAIAGFLFALHNCFRILPLPTIRFGDAQIIDSCFSLGLPEYFDDNHPLDTRPFSSLESQTETLIASDAATRFGQGTPIHVATTESGLLFNHYYFDFLSAFRGHPIHYLPWWFHQVAVGPDAPTYIVHTRGFKDLYPGSAFFTYYPRLEDDVARHLISYKEVVRLNGPSNSQIIVFAKEQLPLIESNSQTSLLLEAEQFNRGNVAVDNAMGSYGGGIGVILTPKPAGYAEYEFRVPSTGVYQIQLRYASMVSRPLTLLIDGNVITRSAASNATGGFMPANQAWVPVAITPLKKGVHVLRLETAELFPHLDRINIVSVRPGTQH